MAIPIDRELIIKSYRNAERRILFLDYDGTLVPLVDLPESSVLPEKTRHIIIKLSSDPGNRVYIVSGRVRQFLADQFAGTGTGLIAEHGMWLKENKGNWKRSGISSNRWKKSVMAMLIDFSVAHPNTFIENKESSVAFHYHLARHFSDRDRQLIRERLSSLKSLYKGLDILEGRHVIEIKPDGYNKGTAASQIVSSGQFGFIMAAGDDLTDEQLFAGLPPGSVTIKVGASPTRARYRITSPDEFTTFLEQVSKEG